MNSKVIFYFLGKICMAFTCTLMIPICMAIFYAEHCVAVFSLAALISLILGYGLTKFGKNANLAKVSVREGIGTVFFSWILIALIASLPFSLGGYLSPAAAYFESMSGLTTTGATAFSDLEILPQSILMWRSITHWIGGIGIIVLFVAFLPQMAGSAQYLFNAEVSGFSSSRIKPRIETTAIELFKIYATLTFLLIAILWGTGMNLYDSIYHSFSAIATGGFSNYNSSVGHYDNAWYEFILGLFMLLAGGNFALYYSAANGQGIKSIWKNLEFRAYIYFVGTITFMITANLVYDMGQPFFYSLRVAFFHVSSFCSTTGFVGVDYEQWPSFSKLLLAMTFFTGACAGSTAGGIKICRLIVLMKTVGAELRRALHPQMLLTVYYDKKRLPVSTIISISRFFFLYIFTVVILGLGVSATGLPVEESIFGVASCVSSVGPSFGQVGATGNFAGVTDIAKLIFSLGMLLGRLELFTALALLRSEYWRKSERW
ncbi:MAG: TrkH family potassium uptake protein [Phascolarctobacterium sp.]|nr:TrkH family potassium uptake protein [Phascolarctobacterium sp.]